MGTGRGRVLCAISDFSPMYRTFHIVHTSPSFCWTENEPLQCVAAYFPLFYVELFQNQIGGGTFVQWVQICGDHFSIETEFDGDRLSRGNQFYGDHLSRGQEVGVRKSRDQMGSRPNESQPSRSSDPTFAVFNWVQQILRCTV